MHRKPHPRGLDTLRFLLLLTLAGLTWVITVFVASRAEDPLGSLALGLLASVMVSIEAFRAASKAQPATINYLAQVEQQRARLRDTGTWRRLGVARVALEIRYDAKDGRYYLLGELPGGVRLLREQWWPSPDRLPLLVDELERAGLRPDDTEGTRVIRARLNLGAWVDPYAVSRFGATS